MGNQKLANTTAVIMLAKPVTAWIVNAMNAIPASSPSSTPVILP